MEIRERQQNGATVIELTGRLTVNDQPGLLKGAVGAAVDRGARHVVLDLSSVLYIDSTRLGELIASHVTLTRVGGSLRLAGAPPRVNELFTMAGLDGVFRSYASIDEAVAAS